MKVYVTVLGDYLEVSPEGRFTLPQKEYTAAELKKIATEINRASRKSQLEEQEEFT